MAQKSGWKSCTEVNWQRLICFRYKFQLNNIFFVCTNSNVDYVDTWKAMERLVDLGLVKSIGISNFNSEQIQRVLNVARIKPVLNQVRNLCINFCFKHFEVGSTAHLKKQLYSIEITMSFFNNTDWNCISHFEDRVFTYHQPTEIEQILQRPWHLSSWFLSVGPSESIVTHSSSHFRSAGKSHCWQT